VWKGKGQGVPFWGTPGHKKVRGGGVGGPSCKGL